MPGRSLFLLSSLLLGCFLLGRLLLGGLLHRLLLGGLLDLLLRCLLLCCHAHSPPFSSPSAS